MQIGEGRKVVLNVKTNDDSVVFKWSGPILLMNDTENHHRYKIEVDNINLQLHII